MTWNRFIVICFLALHTICALAFTPKVDQSYQLSLWAKVPHPQQMAYEPKTSTLYLVSHDSGGALFRIQKEKTEKILDGLKRPSSLVIFKGDLYLTESNQISVIKNIGSYLNTKKKIEKFPLKSGLPDDFQNSLKRILIHDNFLYLSIGAPCNVCLPQDPYGTIQKISLDGKKSEIVARGIRLAGFLSVKPQTSQIWFSDLNREKLGAAMPAAEINILQNNHHYGFPFLHAKEIKDNFYFSQKPKDLSITLPERELPAHSTPTGMIFHKPQCALIVLNGLKHEGVWSEPKVIESCLKNKKWVDKTILDGFLDANSLKGRPFDIISISEKEFLVSDEYFGALWSLKLK
jgi:glucose/arabinose dehydrogenase